MSLSSAPYNVLPKPVNDIFIFTLHLMFQFSFGRVMHVKNLELISTLKSNISFHSYVFYCMSKKVK